METTKIYKLISKNTNKMYIGITDKSLELRLRRHKGSFCTGIWYCSSFNILEHGDCEMILIKMFDKKLNLIEKKEEKKVILEYLNIHDNLVVNCEHNKKYGYLYIYRHK